MSESIFNNVTRRTALRAGALAAGASVLGMAMPRKAAAAVRASAGRAAKHEGLRLAHMTDIHVQPELRADQGLTACLKHIGALPAERKPDLIVTGGDLVMDTFKQEFSRSKQLWDMLTGLFKEHAPVRVEHCLGNHDIWGWDKSKSKTSGAEKGWGKAWAMEALGLAKPFHSFDQGGWHIVMLDSVSPEPKDDKGYIGKLDEAQMDWLTRDLEAVAPTTPVAVVSHIPIMSVTHYLEADLVKDNAFDYSGGKMHLDAARLHRLFASRKNVKLCLSGHIHRRDRVEMDGVTYICDGAVSGAWWKGRKDNCDEGYGLVDLMPDGTFRHEYVEYGWKAEVR